MRLYKVGLSWPIEQQMMLRFAQGLDEVLVIEEKRAFVETQIARTLYNISADIRPRLLGKVDDKGAHRCFRAPANSRPSPSPALVAQRLLALDPATSNCARGLPRLKPPNAQGRYRAGLDALDVLLLGLPHNTSTKVPEGSRAAGGIGCHYMAAFMPSRRTSLPTQMGGEGVNWIGQAPFTNEKAHLPESLGDGTYYHSGVMAIRATVAAKVNITFKILYNDAVAMTGGQHVDGPLTVADVSRQVEAEGARRIVVMSDNLEQYGNRTGFAKSAEFRHRDEIDLVQRELREEPGTTILIYDQTCAAEKRRRRKRGTMVDPDQRIFINERVCEGCGDCSVQSNCISVQPLETEFGRKREINQSSCNKDYSASRASARASSPCMAQRSASKAVSADSMLISPSCRRLRRRVRSTAPTAC